MKHCLQPRIVRIGDAPAYLGMCRSVFEQQVRPRLTIIAIGKKGKGVDRRALDQIADELFSAQAATSPSLSLDETASPGQAAICSGRSAKKGEMVWPAQKCQVSTFAAESGGFGSKSTGMAAFEKALAFVNVSTPKRKTS